MTDIGEGDEVRTAGVRFPIIKNLTVKGYGLYPGPKPANKGLEATFQPGLTVVLGANGLGKTTLVWMIYRLFSGPYEITGLDSRSQLGRRAIEPSKLSGRRKRIFAERVADGAKDATASLLFELGRHTVGVTRSLADLKLIEFTVDGEKKATDENLYQEAVASIAGLWSFGDWILLLHYVVFYFEDRRELVWDAAAQRQILRLLMLPPETARKWTEQEREVLRLDSRVRNDSAVLTRRERELKRDEKSGEEGAEVRQELAALQQLQAIEEEKRDDLDERLLELDTERQSARLAALQAQHEKESSLRRLERAKLLALAESYPSASETARYILSQLLSNGSCLTCGNKVPEVAQALEERIANSQCVICGSEVLSVSAVEGRPHSLSDERLSREVESLEGSTVALKAAQDHLAQVVQSYDQTVRRLTELDAAVSRRRERIDILVRRLPKAEVELHQQRGELALLRRRVASLRIELKTVRADFAAFVNEAKITIAEGAPRIQRLFEEYARDFLVEDCSLAWRPRKERVGQSGIFVEFPAFELDLSSAVFKSPVRRTGPEQVSESQREFIDLAFRMALMERSESAHGGTLVIDAPEASLDAVFVHRAAEVLNKFADSEGNNRLLVTSNLTDGELIPKLLEDYLPDVSSRVIDLFEIAEPTAAVRELREEYREARERIFSAIGKDDSRHG